MTCRELIDVLMEYLDGGLPAEQRRVLERHLSVCSACRDYLHTYEEAIRMGRASLCEHGDGGDPIPGEVPQELVEAVMAAVRNR